MAPGFDGSMVICDCSAVQSAVCFASAVGTSYMIIIMYLNILIISYHHTPVYIPVHHHTPI